MDSLELHLAQLEEHTMNGLEELHKRQELSMKRNEVTDFVVKKFEIIQATIEQNERKILGVIEKRFEDTAGETEEKYNDVTNAVDEVGYLVKEAAKKAATNAEELEKVEKEMLSMMKILNEQAIKTQSIQWMHNEVMAIKERELQIINLLKDHDSVEADFLTQIYPVVSPIKDQPPLHQSN
eukprot:TRINITY_DN10326_c0_g1_i1.p1 TRINITY_DN10326_c0_g1~~TRINITY_DN10326_c0_g1_i1.p1  ORF type:complete len:181 (-),score=43.91 TRINITY_DN10326_c0_g1_i1:124-666(-)